MSLLEAKNLTKSFGGLLAVNDLSFGVEAGETVGLLGPNGAGKTTVFALVSGFYPPTRGSVTFDGRNLRGLRPDQICQLGLTRTFQLVQPFPHLTALENVMVGAFVRHPSRREAEDKAVEVLRLVGMGDKANTLAQSLSVPERKRLELAKALATEPKMVLLDEVMAGLRLAEIEQAVALIKTLRTWGITFLIIEHVMRAVMALADRVVVMHHGEKIAEGEPAEVARNEKVIEAYLGEDALLA